MKISNIQIKNYRSIKSLDLSIESYAALVGANGAGKSSVLYALDWFFNGGRLDLSDVHGRHDATTVYAEGETPCVEVTVTFSDLTSADRKRLEQYGRGATATFKRTWQVGSDKDKVVGNALQGPGFALVRKMKLVSEYRPAYAALRDIHSNLRDVGVRASKDEVVAAFVEWENDASNAGLLEEVSADDASHMFGIGGSHVINQCVRMVLVPAATDISSEVGLAKKGTALEALIGGLMDTAGVEAKQAWIEKNQGVIDDLNTSMLTSLQSSTGLQSKRINERLATLVPNAQIEFTPNIPSWIPSPAASIQTDVSIDGTTNDVSRQGHGIQRAVMIAMFQSLVPDEQLAASQHQLMEGESEEEAAERLASALRELPNLAICIEEPEIYQHPVRARAFARVLAEIAKQPNAQVIIATHSPYFARPEQFTGISRFTLNAGETTVASTSLAEVAIAASKTVGQVEKIVEKRLPTTFSEGFFADTVVLVEGETDRAVLEAIAEIKEKPLDAAGVSVLDMAGKESISIPKSIMEKFNIPTYLIVDADSLGAARKHSANAAKQATAHESHRLSTNAILSILPSSTAIVGSLPFAFEDSTVVCKHYTVWEDDIENELEKWPSFMTALAANGYSIRDKDLLAYRTAVMEASLTDIPATLEEVVEAIIKFRECA